MRARHRTSLFHRVVEHREAGGRAVRPHGGEPHLFQHFAHAVVAYGSGGEGEIHNAEARAQRFCRLASHKFSHAGDLEGSVLYRFRKHVATFPSDAFQSGFHHAGTGYAYVHHAVSLAHAVEGARHEGIVLHGVGEDDEFGAPYPVAVGGELRGLLDYLAHEAHRVHIYARASGAHVHACAHAIGRGKHLGDGADEIFLLSGHRFLHQSGVASDEIHPDLFCRLVHREGYLAVSAARRSDETDGAHRKTLVDDGDAVF